MRDMYINVNGVWKSCRAYNNIGGVWKATKVNKNVNGVWKSCDRNRVSILYDSGKEYANARVIEWQNNAIFTKESGSLYFHIGGDYIYPNIMTLAWNFKHNGYKQLKIDWEFYSIDYDSEIKMAVCTTDGTGNNSLIPEWSSNEHHSGTGGKIPGSQDWDYWNGDVLEFSNGYSRSSRNRTIDTVKMPINAVIGCEEYELKIRFCAKSFDGASRVQGRIYKIWLE